VRSHPSVYESDATFSPDLEYRYSLWRRWSPAATLMVIGLNPSTADEVTDDATVRRCMGFASQWGYGALNLVNVFAYRTTDPHGLYRVSSPVGLSNWSCICSSALAIASSGGAILAAWGAHGALQDAGNRLAQRMDDFQIGAACLGRTSSGQPRHPLYLPYAAAPEPFVGDGGSLCRGRDDG